MDQPYIDGSSTEDLGRMLMALVQEVWVMRDRMAITERLLAARTGITPADIDNYVTDAGNTVVIDALRERFVSKVIGAPSAARDRSVDQILQRAGFGDSRPSEPSRG